MAARIIYERAENHVHDGREPRIFGYRVTPATSTK
jgi:hypothetical protein